MCPGIAINLIEMHGYSIYNSLPENNINKIFFASLNFNSLNFFGFIILTQIFFYLGHHLVNNCPFD